jgi:hypothetical protein
MGKLKVLQHRIEIHLIGLLIRSISIIITTIVTIVASNPDTKKAIIVRTAEGRCRKEL